MSVAAQRLTEPFGIFEEVGPHFEDRHRVLRELDVVEEFGILPDERENGIPQILLFGLDLLDGIVGYRLVASDTEVLLSGGVPPASREFHRGDGLRRHFLV